MPARADRNGRRRWLTVLAILVFLVPAGLGFGNKLLEFFALVSDEAGSFAVMPVLNYLLASIGFFLLLCWAMMNGMFHDVEKPKLAMLESERELDRQTAEEEEQKGWLP